MPIVRYSKPFPSVWLLRIGICCLCWSCLFVGTAQGQSARQFISFGDHAIQTGETYNAAAYYKQGLDRYEGNTELQYKYAEALRSFNDYKSAATYYKSVSESDAQKEYPYAAFWYAMMLHYLGQYDQASTQFKKFKSRHKGKDYYQLKTQQEIESCAWAKAHSRDSLRIRIEHFGDSVNSPFTEFNPYQDAQGHLRFSSLRDLSTVKKKSNFLSRIYQLDTAHHPAIDPTIHVADSTAHIANGCFNPSFDRFYFTICDPTPDDRGQYKCKIFGQHTDGSLAHTALDSTINLPGFTATQPNIGIDSLGVEWLYFVSDRPGSIGKTDIWRSRISSDSYAPPENLGPRINTIDQEFSPFYDSDKHILYFASDWHYGFGGLDIFQTTLSDTQWTKPVNLGRPINSSANDFYFYKSIDRGTNYLSSNRIGAFYLKAATCCNDIWAYHTTEHKIKRPEPKQTLTTLRDTLPTSPPVAINTSIDSHSVAQIPPNLITRIDSHTISRIQPPAHITHTTTQIDTSERVWIDRSITHIKQLLPVTLYFHNDQPDCCTLSDTTALSYAETYETYSNLLADYRRQFAHGLSATDRSKAEKEIFDLFSDRVDKGYHDLIQFSGQLLDLLHSGAKIEITIQGFCSPLHYNQYNIKLGYRRIASLRNYLYHYRSAALMPYMNSGQLILRNESIGEEKAPKSVSDQFEDTRNSVYNPAAALERKVEIISVEIK